ncbi:SPOR domain-containing protein [Pseudodesulfovibrio piezophilus]|uniref:Sporulation domain protein n=1 Tax=Pseudodesulfovibrio piezophilus (strain DSM 21447 / JCM 15486 / C1TLV30) TaxID=1322246 RepID=M1WSQ3_PSEP2|nr:SPOR domain-containing protein [Pseudodesulfovibrio piezophilus]CCH49027.1 Sporulation domain protein [Pseudodesulfovibrio piezophilus C1TLV30]
MADPKGTKFKVKVPKLNATKKTYDFSFSLSGMISAVGAGVLALTFFFTMGILIGRGYRPEVDVPQLQEIMPSKEHGQIALEPGEQILKPEELDYPERLQQTPEKVMAEGLPKVEPEVKAKKEARQAEASKSTSVQTSVSSQKGTSSAESVFDYIYQVAAFRKDSMAEALSDKLVADGLKTSIQAATAKGKTWYRVQVHYYGTPSSTAGMKAILARHGIAKPLLKKKVATQ